MCCAASFKIGTMMNSCAPNGGICLIAGRVINGPSNGCMVAAAPLRQSEVTPEEIGGRRIPQAKFH